MTREQIEARLAELGQLKRQQQQRLEHALNEQRSALASLERVEGACQDCQYWLTQLAGEDQPSPEGVCRNGTPLSPTD